VVNAQTSTQSSAALDVFVRLLRAHAAVTRLLSAQLQHEHGLTINAYEALLQLSRAESPMRRVDLANSLLLTASGVTRLLDGLERAGLVARKACPSDARASYSELTDAGHAKLHAASESHIAAVCSRSASRTTSWGSSHRCSTGFRASTRAPAAKTAPPQTPRSGAPKIRVPV
jgi:DNA-binding MarR family transcriptional regulator